MKNTTNYSLLLPDETDFYDIGDANSNVDLTDAEFLIIGSSVYGSNNTIDIQIT